MGWFDRLTGRGRSQTAAPATPAPEIRDIALFPLHTVLFPGGRQPLKVFEQRYLDMVAACMKAGEGFGICLIAAGKEVGEAAEPHPVGTLADIGDWDMPELGILHLTVSGNRRFKVIESRTEADNLLRARVELLAEPAAQAVPEAHQGLVTLLEQIAADLGPERLPEPHAFDDAAWVGYRLTEVMPVQPLAKQKLLELDDPLSRLEILHKYLAQKGLVS